MKRVFNKILTCSLLVALSVILVFSSVACNKNEEAEENPFSKNHVAVIKDTEEFIVRSARSDYKIVIPKTPDSYEKIASNELYNFFKEGTGISLPIISDENITYNENDKYISIGNTVVAEGAGVKPTADKVKAQGFNIKTNGNTVILRGATPVGSLYATYEFLSYILDYEYCFTDVYRLNTGVSELKLKDYDVTEIPDIDMLAAPSVGYINYNPTNSNRMRSMQISDWSIPQNNYNNVHAEFKILPPDTFYKDHPKWFAGENPKSLCYSAHGDAEEYALMLTEIEEVIKRGLEKTEANIFAISQNDNAGFCTCSACLESKNKYGANSALLIKMCNAISDYFDEWFTTEEGKPFKRDLKVIFLAYQELLDPPVKYSEAEKKYVPTYPEVMCKDNVGVWIASDGFNYSLGMNSPVNETLLKAIENWSVLTHNFTFWIYDVNFNAYLYPYDSMYVKQDLYKFMAKCGAMVLNDQSQTQNAENSTAWANYKSYISTKLRWNVYADINKLTKDYFDICYKDASEIMYSIYLQSVSHSRIIINKIEKGEISGSVSAMGGIFGGIKNKAFWDKGLVESWYNGMKEALNKIEHLKTENKRAYDNTYKMITAEIVSPMYILMSLYSTDYSQKTYDQMGATFKKYCTDSGLSYYFDSTRTGSIENLYKDLKIS